jgi:hypothetical protein
LILHKVAAKLYQSFRVFLTRVLLISFNKKKLIQTKHSSTSKSPLNFIRAKGMGPVVRERYNHHYSTAIYSYPI